MKGEPYRTISRLQCKLLTSVGVDRAEYRGDSRNSGLPVGVLCKPLGNSSGESLVAEFYGPDELYILAIVEVCN